MAVDVRPLVLHVVHRFDTGGLENGLVNLINHMPAESYRHTVLALTEVSEFRQRVKRAEVEFIAMNKPPGQGFKLYPRLWKLLRQLRPAIMHTRNLGPLEMQVVAAAARVPVRVHGEHGRDVGDLDGNSRHHQRIRRIYSPAVQHWVALSRDLQGYLVDRVGIPAERISQIYNGVDTERFHPAREHVGIPGCPFDPQRHWLVGTVGRMQEVKGSTFLAHAFVQALEQQPALRERLRLVMVGDGPLRTQCQSILADAGMTELAWLPGERQDVPEVMRGLDCFVLPSLAEGISNTILEAMASGLPVIATRVGGNPELVDDARTGVLVPCADTDALTLTLTEMASQVERAAAMGRTGRRDVENRFSLQAMVASYQTLYDRRLSRAARGNYPI